MKVHELVESEWENIKVPHQQEEKWLIRQRQSLMIRYGMYLNKLAKINMVFPNQTAISSGGMPPHVKITESEWKRFEILDHPTPETAGAKRWSFYVRIANTKLCKQVNSIIDAIGKTVATWEAVEKILTAKTCDEIDKALS